MNKLFRQIRIAIINNSLSHKYWSYGDHWLDGFEDAGCKVDVYKYEDIKHLAPGYDLYFFMEVRYSPEDIPWYCTPRCMYTFDMHVVGGDRYTKYEDHFDLIFAASRADVDHVVRNGHNKFRWMPEACNPKVHYDTGSDRPVDVGFIGSPDSMWKRNYLTREDFFGFIRNSKWNHLIEWGVYGDLYREKMNSFKISFDRGISHNLGCRIFEASAFGCVPLFSKSFDNRESGVDQIFIENVHYISYDDTFGDLENKINLILNDADLRHRISTNAKNHVNNYHTYKHRVVSILEQMGISCDVLVKV